MIGLVLDILVLMGFARLVGNRTDEGPGKPAIIAVLTTACIIAADVGTYNSPENALLFFLGALGGTGLIVGICCYLLLQIPLGKSAVIAVGFVIYKTAFLLFLAIISG